ncbi:sporulation protein YunB [Cohnella yongneupensis]|uniref:Sporulation protein YunB n=1 Tax=Cohnella yongneupensis TaxID=425006 RepID=A0ABW0R2U5_9BACL
MARKWGISLPKPAPRKWGRGRIMLGGGFKPKTAPRKWGTRKWFSASRPSVSVPAAKWASKRPRRRLKRKHMWMITIFFVLFLIVQGVLFLDRELRGPLMFLAKIRVTQMATEAINTAITEEIAQTVDSDQLLEWKTNAAGKVTGLVLDYKQQMSITAKTIEVVTRTLKEHEDMPEHIPIGHALNSPFISSIGPSVSVKFHPVSAVKVDVDTRSTEAGINNLLVEVFVRIRTDIAVIIPFDQEPEPLETEIPLSYVMVVGDVPTYYYDNHGNPVGNSAPQAPVISLPKTETPVPVAP